ncbi:hypothetical protein ACFY19_01045 [Streptosporangium saharense]|uniref:Uncharacterized protein n=1 Tax=Streptosporangium saharense TaxID=1706840 RepID=A0A7W7VRF2_9ACTN|nr:hypothetical protein [Streptosporangium saharense]MBB4919335.1 hypothetical protein [Streptosporangium saharense]
MLAIAAAVVFGLGLLLDLINTRIGGITGTTFILGGLLLLALHQAGVGTAGVRSGTGGSWRRRR